VKINGALRQEIKGPDDLTYTSDCPDIWLRFDKVHTGFWLGGLMWRGQLVVDRKAAPGDYQLSVFRKFAPEERPFSTFLIKVYANETALRRNSKSFLERYLAVSPWRLFALGLVCSLVSFGLAFYLSSQREQLLAKEGKAEIFRIIETPEGREVHFSLGAKDGVQSDSRLVLMDDKARYLSTLRLKQITETDSSAMVDPEQHVEFGYLVALSRSSSKTDPG